jgi:hypothetical protein
MQNNTALPNKTQQRKWNISELIREFRPGICLRTSRTEVRSLTIGPTWSPPELSACHASTGSLDWLRSGSHTGGNERNYCRWRESNPSHWYTMLVTSLRSRTGISTARKAGNWVCCIHFHLINCLSRLQIHNKLRYYPWTCFISRMKQWNSFSVNTPPPPFWHILTPLFMSCRVKLKDKYWNYIYSLLFVYE